MQSTHTNAEVGTAKVSHVYPLTNTEKTWRVGQNCYGLDLLTISQRHMIHNLKTSGFILDNVTPSGFALMTGYGQNCVTMVDISPTGKATYSHI